MIITLSWHAEQLLEEDRRRFPALTDLHPFHLERVKAALLERLKAHVDLRVRRRLVDADRDRYADLVTDQGWARHWLLPGQDP